MEARVMERTNKLIHIRTKILANKQIRSESSER